MSRYIDADALIERILKLKVATDNMYGMGIARGIERAETAIQMQPTADVEEVVRCKDCKHCLTDDYTMYCERATGLDQILPDDFCSYGERREE